MKPIWLSKIARLKQTVIVVISPPPNNMGQTTSKLEFLIDSTNIYDSWPKSHILAKFINLLSKNGTYL